MAIDRKMEAAVALHRFGFGPVRDQIVTIADDPRGALIADLERPGAGSVSAGNLPSSTEAARALNEFQAEQQAKRRLEDRAKKEAEAKTAAMAGDEMASMQASAAAAAEHVRADRFAFVSAGH